MAGKYGDWSVLYTVLPYGDTTAVPEAIDGVVWAEPGKMAAGERFDLQFASVASGKDRGKVAWRSLKDGLAAVGADEFDRQAAGVGMADTIKAKFAVK